MLRLHGMGREEAAAIALCPLVLHPSKVSSEYGESPEVCVLLQMAMITFFSH